MDAGYFAYRWHWLGSTIRRQRRWRRSAPRPCTGILVSGVWKQLVPPPPPFVFHYPFSSSARSYFERVANIRGRDITEWQTRVQSERGRGPPAGALWALARLGHKQGRALGQPLWRLVVAVAQQEVSACTAGEVAMVILSLSRRPASSPLLPPRLLPSLMQRAQVQSHASPCSRLGVNAERQNSMLLHEYNWALNTGCLQPHSDGHPEHTCRIQFMSFKRKSSAAWRFRSASYHRSGRQLRWQKPSNTKASAVCRVSVCRR